MSHDEPGGLLRMIVAVLETARIPHMVVGSFASTAHGEPRTTRDLDLVIDPSPDQLNELIGALDPERFYLDPDVARDALRRRSMFNVIEIATAWKLDLVIRKARPFSIEEMQRRTLTRILGMDVPTATAEDTIIAKLEWAKLGASDRGRCSAARFRADSDGTAPGARPKSGRCLYNVGGLLVRLGLGPSTAATIKAARVLRWARSTRGRRGRGPLGPRRETCSPRRRAPSVTASCAESPPAGNAMRVQAG
jgi:hypothetical protein